MNDYCKTLLVSIPVLFACGQPEPQAAASDSIPVPSAGVTSEEQLSIGPAHWTISPEPSLVIGALSDGDPRTLFSFINDAAMAPNGDIFVVDGGTREIRRFDHTGRPLGVIGRSGGGPGEFGMAPFVVSQGDDRLLAWDPSVYRFSTFTASGRLVNEVSISAEVSRFGLVRVPSRDVWKLADSGGALWLGPDSRSFQPRGDTVTYPALSFWQDPLATLDLGRHLVGLNLTFEDRAMSYPLAPSTHVAPGPGPRQVTMADPENWAVSIFDQSGNELRKLVLAIPRVPVTPELLARERDSLVVATERLNRPGLGSVQDAFESVPLPEFLPAIAFLEWDPDGNLWVGRRAGRKNEISSFDVVSVTGEHIAEVEFAAAVDRILEIGRNEILAVHSDAFGVEYLWRISIAREDR